MFLTAFGLAAKDYALVYDTGTTVLALMPRKATGGATKAICEANFPITPPYVSSKPQSDLLYYNLIASSDALGTAFDTVQGFMTVLTKQKPVNGVTEDSGALGSITAVAKGTTQRFLYSFTFSATKPLRSEAVVYASVP